MTIKRYAMAEGVVVEVTDEATGAVLDRWTEWYADQRLKGANDARERWLAACDAKLEHAVVNALWLSYVRLARLAGIDP